MKGYMSIISTIKSHFYLFAGTIIGLLAFIFIKNQDTLQAITGFFRRKEVEDVVDKIKSAIASDNVDLAANNEKIVLAAEALKQQKANIGTMSDQDIKDFYNNYFK